MKMALYHLKLTMIENLKKEFERKYKKRLTKKSLTEYITKAVEASYKESKNNEK